MPTRSNDSHAPSHDENSGAENGEDFASMLAEEGKLKPLKLHVGDKVSAKVIHVAKESVFFELSRAQEAVMPRQELLDADGKLTVKVGDRVEAFVLRLGDGITLSRKLGKDNLDAGLLEDAQRAGMPIEGQVTGVNKGGLEVMVGNVRAFCPMKAIDLGFVETPEQYVGKTLAFVVREVREGGRNVVLDRRALLEAERDAKGDKLLQTLAVGQRLRGKVTRLQPFGAFVDLGGVDGLIPASELSHARVRVEDVLKVGDEVEVDVLKIEPDPKDKTGRRPRIALSLKATQQDPWVAHAGALTEGQTLAGKVMRLEKFGAFVELFGGVEGLVHVSELSDKRVRHPSDVAAVGQAVSVRVLGVDLVQRRIALTLKDAPPVPDQAPVVGLKVSGKVERHERFGVFVNLDGGLGSALLPAAESGTPPGTDLVRVFPMGSTVEAQIIAVDERGRLKISKRAREQAEERDVVAEFNRAQGGGGLGTLADRFKQKPLKKR